MVSKIIAKVFNKEWDGLHEAAFLLGTFALFSQLLALIRDRLLAHTFGAGSSLDIYYAAFRIPDLIFASVGSFVAVTVLIPFLIKRLHNNDQAGHAFFNQIFSIFFIAIVVVSIIAYMLIPYLGDIVAPGFTPSEKEELAELSRILLLSPILLGLSNLLGSITQSFRRFFVYAASPVLYNIGIIAGIVFLYPLAGLAGLAYGVVFGAFLHMAVQIPVIMRHGFMLRFLLSFDWPTIRDVIRISLPRTAALSTHHFSLLVLISLASLLRDGSVSVFNLSFNLQSVPLSIIGISYSVAAFPTLARLFENGEREKFLAQIEVAARHIIFWSLPASVLFIVLRAQIVRTIFGSGHFDWNATRLAAACLALFSVSIAAQSLAALFTRGFYARGETRTPLIINVFSGAVVILSAFLFLKIFEASEFTRYFFESLMRLEGVAGSAIIMLPFAYAVGLIVNAFLLFYMFQKSFREFGARLRTTFFHSFSASVVMGFIAWIFLDVFDNFFNLGTFMGVFLQGLCAGLIGIVAGICILKILKNTEITEITRSIRHKFWRTKGVIAPDQGEL